MLSFQKLIVALLMILAGAVAWAKVLIVSDIDDTLKVSHILSKRGSFSSAFDDRSLFVGMPEIFQILKSSYKDIEFHYVSLAPHFLMNEQHQDFLRKNGFPVTGLHMNSGIRQDPQLKQKVIRRLLQDRSPTLVVYFGDNGQFDTIVYDQMAKEFPHIPAVSYIREVYSSRGEAEYPTKSGQIGFVTSVEVALDLIEKNLFPPKAYNFIEGVVHTRLGLDDGYETFGPMVFPWWQDCRDFYWRWPVQNPSEKLMEIRQTIRVMCHSEDLWQAQ